MALNPKTRTEYFIAGREGELPIGSRDPETRIEFFLAGREDELPAGHREPESRLEHFIKDYRSGEDVTVIPLTVTENGDYSAPEGKAYSPVAVSVALPEDAYIKKSIPSTPTAIANFTDGAEMVMPSLTVGVDAWQEGSGDPSPSNVRTIHGWDSVKVSVSGVNIWDEEWEVGTITGGNPAPSPNSICSKNFCRCVGGQKYYGKCGNYTNSYFMRIWWYDDEKNYINNEWIADRITTAPNNAKWFKISTNTGTYIYGNTYNNDISINYPSTDTDYHAYNGHTYTINLGGTRYGGRLEIVNGVARFVGTHGYADLGTLDWAKQDHASLGTYFYGNAASLGIKATGNYSQIVADAICSNYTATRRYSTVFTNGTFCYDGSTASVTQIQIKDDNYSDAETFATAMNGVQLRYELAEQIIIPLGNYPISTLVGENNLFADSGEILEGEYLGGVS